MIYYRSLIKFSLFITCFFLLFTSSNSWSGTNPLLKNTDTDGNFLFSFYDLRERESYVQITNIESDGKIIHVQIFNVDDDCNENNFFDTLTPNDTHTYNMRDIQTNDGNPSGVVLPENAYGFVAIISVTAVGGSSIGGGLIGNFRVIDDNGYEYRTNSHTRIPTFPSETISNFNFNNTGNVNLSDVIGYVVSLDFSNGEVLTADLTNNFAVFDIDILDINEVPLSCRDVIFACVDEDNPRLEELLEEAGSASVARFEYGINNTIPHSKGGELLCPGNTIDEGFVRLSLQTLNTGSFEGTFGGFIGLNNGNGRGSMDSFWGQNFTLLQGSG